MSHTVKVPVSFRTSELPCLLKAFQALGWSIRENAEIRAYSESQVRRYPYVAVNPVGRFDVGLRPAKNPEHSISVETDTYDSTILQQLGKDYSKLKSAFAMEVLREEFPTGQFEITTEQDQSQLVTVSVYA